MRSESAKLRNWFVVLAALGVLTVAAAAEESWLAFTSDGVIVGGAGAATAPAVVVDRSDDTGLAVNVTTGGVLLSERATKGGAFVEVHWPEASVAGEVGTPALPVVRRLLIAPPLATVSLSVNPGPARVVSLAELGQTAALMPVQAPIPKLPGARERAPFDYDAAAYAVDADWPATRATLEELGVVRGQRLFLLEVAPVAYNPTRGTLTVWSELAVDVEFTGDTAWSYRLSPLPGLKRRVLNPEPLAAGARSMGNLLIVVASDYEDVVGPFVAAKLAQGYNATTWVPSSSSATAIKDYIADAYDGPSPPDYVLLVGDTNTIPNWTGGGAGAPATDLPYVCMDEGDDWYPDIAIGRFPVRNEGQYQAMVDKILYFEEGPPSDPELVMRAVFMASEDNWTVSEGTHNWVIENHMDPAEIVSDKLYCHTYSATTQQVSDCFNDGRFFGIYSGHGATTYWADGPYFTQSNVNALINEDLYGFVFSFACITGTYTLDECFVETWVRAQDKGAAAMYGSSVNSYWTEDDVLEKRLFDAIYDEEDEVPGQLGPVWNDTLTRYLEQMGAGSTTRRYFEMYNLMGDPTMFFPGAGPVFGISYPEGLPEYITPGEPTTLSVRIDGTEPVVPGSPTLHYRLQPGYFTLVPLTPLGDGLYEVTIPACTCDDHLEYYFTALGEDGSSITDPPSALYEATVGTVLTLVDDDFETDLGWTVEDVDVETGSWECAVPGCGGERGDPATDCDGSGKCFVTDNRVGNFDVDGGPTRLISPTFDLSDTYDPIISVSIWWYNDDQDGDPLDIEVSSDDGVTWVAVETIANVPPGWVEHSFHVADYVAVTGQVRVRFSATDAPNNSVDEGGVDALQIIDIFCNLGTVGDMNCDGAINFFDIEAFVLAVTDGPAYEAAYPDCYLLSADCNGDGAVDFFDIDAFVELVTGG